MKQRWLQVLTMAALAAGAAACSDGPASIKAPVSQPRAAFVDGYTTLTGVDGKKWLVLTGVGKDVETKSAVIDNRGGEIQMSGTSLTVPRDAVKGPTTFTMTVFTKPYLKVQFSAVAVTGGGRGGRGGTAEEIHTFNGKSLTLELSYTCAKRDLPDPSKLRMLNIENDVVLEVLKPSAVQIDRKNIIVQIWHFSEYGPGLDQADAGAL